MKIPSRFGAFVLVCTAGFALGSWLTGRDLQSVFLTSAAAQTVNATPAGEPVDPANPQAQGTTAAKQAPAVPDREITSQMAHTDAKGRHLAPRGTFYLLSYVSAKTDKGVEGFDPGQEVHFVEVHHDTHTLVVTDGHAQVEVPPSKLTNDMDIAAMVRRNDQANQAQIAAYIQAEETAYNKMERDAAVATAKDLEHREEAQDAQTRTAEQAQAEQQATPQENVPVEDNAYYGEGGYGYGSPYSYFSGGQSVIAYTPKTPATAAPATQSAPAVNKVAAPSAPAAGVGRPK